MIETEFCQLECAYDTLLHEYIVLLDRLHTDTDYNIFWIVRRADGTLAISAETDLYKSEEATHIDEN